jgi:hypothetical protein
MRVRTRTGATLVVPLVLATAMAAAAACTAGRPARHAPAAPSGAASASPTPDQVGEAPPAPPPKVTDGCRGLVTAAQVARASGLPLVNGGGDQAAAVQQFTQAVAAQGLRATVRLCVFSDPRGDQVYLVALGFPDATQAGRMFDSGRTAATLSGGQPVAGLGDAAVTDGSHTVLVRRRTGVLLVYLATATNPDGDHLAVLRAVATAGLGRL